MLKWLPENPNASEERLVDGMIDQSTLDTLIQLMGGQYIDIIESYIAYAKEAVSGIEKAAENGDAKGVREKAHGLKASSKQLGALRLGELAAELEERGLRERIDDIGGLLVEFSDVGERVIDEFENHVALHKAS